MFVVYILLSILCLTKENNLNEALVNTDEFQNYLNQIKVFLKEDVSHRCKKQLQFYQIALAQNQLWALKMFDAGGKFPSGILDGLSYEFGMFDDCLNVQYQTGSTNEIKGKYCLAEIPPNQQNRDSPIQKSFYLGICVPNGCSASELQKFYQGLIDNIVIREQTCPTKETHPKLKVASIAFICFCAIILSLMVISTVYEVIALWYLKKNKPLHPLLVSFSIITNGSKLLAVSENSKQISCLNGLRTISTMWVIFKHTILWQPAIPSKNNFVEDWKNNIGLLQHDLVVDTFFVMSGLVISYGYMVSSSRGNTFNIILHYLHRYLRLTPIIVIQMIIDMHLIEYFGSGPYWKSFLSTFAADCSIEWWRSLVYMQNYKPFLQCIGHTWYLAVDMQLYLLSPILLIPLVKWPKLGKVLVQVLIAVSIVLSFYTAYVFKLSASAKSKSGRYDYVNKYYLRTQTRASTWLIGVLLGNFIYFAKQGKRYIINKVLIFGLWVWAIVILLVCVYSRASLSPDYNMLENVFQIGLVRPAWAIAVAWIILACVMECGGPANWFLSLPIFEVLGKLTFTLYVTHYTLIMTISAQMRVPPYVTTLSVMHTYWGNFMFAVAMSTIFYLAFECPFANIESYVFSSRKRKSH